MKTAIILLTGMAGVLCAAAPADRTAWKWEAPMIVSQVGMARLELPLPVLDVTRSDLGDIRLLSPSGVEVPYLVERPVRRMGVMRNAAGFKLALSGKTTVIEADVKNSGDIEAVVLDSPAREFLKSVVIEGQRSDGEWRTLATNEVVFRQSGGPERLTIPIPAGAWDHLRCTVDDDRAEPIPFTGLRVRSVGEMPATEELRVLPRPGEREPGESLFWLDLPSRNLNLAELRFEIQDAVFSRSCDLAVSTPAPDGKPHLESIANGVLYRVAGDRGGFTESLVVPIHRQVAEASLLARFHNGDSPPLSIRAARVLYYPTVVVFHAAETGEWRLLTGNRGARVPEYDVARLRPELAAAGGRRIAPGPLVSKADYQIPETLPGMEPVGSVIDLADWKFRRPVILSSPGVVRIELDAQVLAACRGDLGDLRLVQNGRQIPYLAKPGRVTRELTPAVDPVPADPKRPTVSRWKITLPVDGLPVENLSARSTSAMFVRHFVVNIERKDELGNKWIENAGAADWTKSGSADTRLALHLGGVRMPRTFVLETDHGDNPPVPVDDLLASFAAPSLAAKLTDSAPVFLYYGNAGASAPRYDLALVRNELLASDQQALALGVEEILKPGARDKRGVDAGSPWLWLALGGVVVALLWIVARLLPERTAG